MRTGTIRINGHEVSFTALPAGPEWFVELPPGIHPHIAMEATERIEKHLGEPPTS